jgi:hypothetical protein
MTAFAEVPASVSKTCLVRLDNNKYLVAGSAVPRGGPVRGRRSFPLAPAPAMKGGLLNRLALAGQALEAVGANPGPGVRGGARPSGGAKCATCLISVFNVLGGVGAP